MHLQMGRVSILPRPSQSIILRSYFHPILRKLGNFKKKLNNAGIDEDPVGRTNCYVIDPADLWFLAPLQQAGPRQEGEDPCLCFVTKYIIARGSTVGPLKRQTGQPSGSRRCMKPCDAHGKCISPSQAHEKSSCKAKVPTRSCKRSL